MSRSLPVVALLLVPLLQSCASTCEAPVEDAAGVAAELTRQADAWDKAIVRKDLDAIAENMTADFRLIRKNGDVIDRRGFLRDITSPELVIEPYTVEDFDVRVLGDTALLSGRTRMTGSEGGTPFTTHYRYIDVYVRRDGKWRVCNVQISPMPD